MNASLEEITQKREKGPLRQMVRSQPFWVTIALALICVVMSQVSDVFFSEDNFFNVTRNFAFIGIIAIGMTAVIITGVSIFRWVPLSGCQASSPAWCSMRGTPSGRESPPAC
jgi:predicted ABC-type sugar transport system permease subunit